MRLPEAHIFALTKGRIGRMTAHRHNFNLLTEHPTLYRCKCEKFGVNVTLDLRTCGPDCPLCGKPR